MATYYWVGGTGTWDSSTTTNWSTTSGGPGGSGVPTSVDDAVFNNLSSASGYTVTVVYSAVCKNLSVAAPATGIVTFTGNSTVIAYGNVTFAATPSTIAWTFTDIELLGTSTLTTNGVAIGANGSGIYCNGSSVSLGSALTINYGVYVSTGTFATNNYSITVTGVSGTEMVYFGGSSVSLGSSTISTPSFSTGYGTVVNTNTSNITAANFKDNNGLTYYNVVLKQFSGFGNSLQAPGSNFNTLTFTHPSSGVLGVSIIGNFTTTSLVFNSSTNSWGRLALYGTSSTSLFGPAPTTVTASSVSSIADVDFQYITAAGASGTWSGTRLGNMGGNSNITFSTAKTVYWGSVSGGNYGSSNWSTSVGGATSASNFPLPQDTAIFPSSYPNSGQTIVLDSSYNVGTVDTSGRTTNTLTLDMSTNVVTVYVVGNWINGSGCAVSGTLSSNLFFQGISATQTITNAGVIFNTPVSIIAPGSTVTLQDAMYMQGTGGQTSLFLLAGTFNSNGYTVSITNGAFDGSANYFSRTLAMGTSAFIINGGGFASYFWDCSNSASLMTVTFTAGATISCTYSGTNILRGGNLTWPTINLGAAGQALTISYAKTTNSFYSITNTAQPATVVFPAGLTTTFANNFQLSGTSGNLVKLNSSTSGTKATISLASGTVNASYLSIKDSNATGGATWNASNSTNGGDNAGWNFLGSASISGFFFAA